MVQSSPSVFNIMNFSMFTRSHVRSIEKTSTMSKIIQEKKTGEELVVAKPRPVCLISTGQNRGLSSSFGPDVSNVPGNPQLDSGL